MTTATIQARMAAARTPLPPDVSLVHRCPGCGELMFLKPVIQCGHCGEIVPMRCFAYRSGDWYYAECIDLNLIARGRSEEDAVAHLQEQMFSYVDAAFAKDDVSQLIPRRASFSSFVHYYWRKLFAHLRHIGRKHFKHYDGDLRDVGTKILSHC